MSAPADEAFFPANLRAEQVQRLTARIEALEAAMRQSVDDWRKRGRRIEALEVALQSTATAIEALAFEMPPPNPYTPQFVMIANSARAALTPEQDK